MNNATAAPTCLELREEIEREIESISSDILTYDERAAIQSPDDGHTTTERAIDALRRTERFKGEHDGARAWLRHHAPGIGIFRRRDDE